jgi:competence protein ComEC
LRSLLFLAGNLLALWLPAESRVAAVLPAVAVLLLPLCFHRRLRPVLPLLLGYGLALLAARSVLAPAPGGGERLLVHAAIESIPAWGESGWQFDADVRFTQHPDWPSQRVRFTMPAGRDVPATGERWQLAAQFEPARGAAQRRALLRDHVSSVARVRAGPLNRRLAPAARSLARLRAGLAQRITARVADPAAGALLAALAVGVTGDVTARQWQIFNATGITHLVAISGMHVTFFAMLSMALARQVWRRSPALAIRLRRELFAAAVGIAMAFGYALLSGFSVPAQRTALMLAAFVVMRECARAARPAWSIAVALTAVLLFDPLAALSAGFWLSFIAVAAIMLIAGARLQSPAPLVAAVQLQWLVTVALLPVTLAIFGSFSAIGILANALAIPAFTFLLVPPVLVATACYLLPGGVTGWCGDRLVDLAAWVAGAIWPLLSRCADLPAAVWRAQPPGAWYLFALAAVACVLLPVARVLRATGIAALCLVFVLRPPAPAAGELWIDVLDVGTANAVLLRTKHRLVLWGTAETFGSNGRRFETRVLPMLRASGHQAIDLWLPGALSRDAQGALLRAAAGFTVRATWLPAAPSPPPELSACMRRDWNWDGVRFAVRPGPDGKECALTATVAGGRLLLGAGQANRAPETAGPPGTNTLALLPRAASAVARFPASAALSGIASVGVADWASPAWQRQRLRLEAAGATVLSTAEHGDIRLRLGADGRWSHRGAAARMAAIIAMRFGYHARPCGNLC